MKLAVVLVTFNRLDKLKIALKAYHNQLLKMNYIIVVDNCSTDGTSDFLEEWKNIEENYTKIVLSLDKNYGGAGGFYYGLNKAIEYDVDWIWVADDDAFPEKEAISNFNNFLYYNNYKTISAVSSAVINNGKIHLQHRNHLKKGLFKVKFTPSLENEYKKDCFNIDIFSYVGTILNKQILLKAGLTEKDYFIYCDDQEHSIRLRKYGSILCVPSIKVHHDTPGFTEKKFFWGEYYHIRNDLLMRRKYFPFQFFLRWIKGYFYNVVLDNSISFDEKELRKAAYSDAMKNQAGIHTIYKPGWKSAE